MVLSQPSGRSWLPDMKMFFAVFAAVLLAGAVLIGYVNNSKKQDEAADRAYELSNKSLLVTVELVMLKKDKASVEALRDAIVRARENVRKGGGTLKKRDSVKESADQALSVKDVLEIGTAAEKELAKLLEGL